MSETRIEARGPRRTFQLTMGRVEGYTRNAVPVAEDEVRKVILNWLRLRVEAGRFQLPGVLTFGHVLYAWPTDAGAGTSAEPVAQYAGDVSPAYCLDVGDREVEDALNDLAARLAKEFKQTRIYVSYLDRTWVVQRGEMPDRSRSE